MNNITIECVWSPSRRQFNKFLKDINKTETKVIDYVAIKKKLIKADPYMEEPSDSIVGFTIINNITRYTRSDEEKVNRVIYLFKNLNVEIINNFKELINSRAEREFSIELTVVQGNIAIEENIYDLFETVNIIKQ